MKANKGERMEAFQPKFILCPTDFSEPATLALYYGKHLADCFGARLVVLYADPFSPPPYLPLQACHGKIDFKKQNLQ